MLGIIIASLLLSISFDRMEEIYKDAVKICPIDIKEMPDKPEGQSPMDIFVEARHYTNDEKILLINYCLMYIQGREQQLLEGN